jgi:hypothetical protein
LADKSQKKELRRQRRQEEKDKRIREQRRQTLFVWGGLAAIVLVTGFVVFQTVNPANQPGEFMRDQGNQHLSSVDEAHIPYNSTPPTSGPHMGGLWNWGISEEPIVAEWQVHNLEDGGVILQYDCPEGCPELQAQLTEFANRVLNDTSLLNPASNSVHFILAPYSGILNASGGKPIALTAWTRIQYFDQVDQEAMMRFIRAYINLDHHVRGIS